MTKRLNISYDSDALEAISSEFDLRAPNKEALRQLIFTLDGDYDPEVMQVLNLATGVGKTYLMAAFVEYLRRQGVGNVVIVTPGKTVQAKTVQNFRPGSPRYITGSPVPPEVVTPQDYSAWVNRQNGAAQLSYGREVPVLAFIFNIQQLIAPKQADGDTHGNTQDAMRRKPRRFDENAGVLFDYLKSLDDLVVIADESHLYGTSAVAFNAALKELDPAAAIGLTASVGKDDHVVFEYPLYRAIQDRYVKAPVLAFRRGGYGTDTASEEQQLRDALQLRQIKQAHYDAYAASVGAKHVNAVAFVVCSDVEHATQVADLLRTPEYLGNDAAVLQVDSKHEDDLTQQRLENLDQPGSPVLAVVSVNKLKEGWDVKNIAVVVTLRAMASEVLTQQTMGRGLRLPFGKYTDVLQIDQLDIIAHQSFQELLAAENVLQQFGLEEAVAAADQAGIAEAIRRAAETGGAAGIGEGQGSVGGATAVESSSIDGGEDAGVGGPAMGVIPLGEGAPDGGTGVVAGLGVRTIPEGGDLGYSSDPAANATRWELVTISRNERFTDVNYSFPVTEMHLHQPEVNLTQIENRDLASAAHRVTSTGDIMFRKEIIAALGKKLRVQDTESAQVDSLQIPDDDARDALIKLVIDMNQVPKNPGTKRYVSDYLVPKFMGEASFNGWTVKSLASARTQLQEVVQEHVRDTLRGSREEATIHPKQLPGGGRTLRLGERVHEQVESREEFVRGRTYGGWFKSLFEEESFDSYSGEYQLAKLLNSSPDIVWWHRLHPQDGAFIHYTARDRYFPDFVARDAGGVYWIIEGKSELGRDDASVQAKRKAAETLVRKLVTMDEYAGQNWGYLIAYEADIARADTWEDLKSSTQPVSNVV